MLSLRRVLRGRHGLLLTTLRRRPLPRRGPVPERGRDLLGWRALLQRSVRTSAVRGPEGRELCRPAVAGVSRCQGEGARDMCLADGEECATPDDCCGGVCVPDAEGVLRCGSACVPDGSACTRSADCCSGNCRTNGTCGPAEVDCLPLGADCTEDADCCAGGCDEATMTCGTILF